jgi:hypothetical protein
MKVSVPGLLGANVSKVVRARRSRQEGFDRRSVRGNGGCNGGEKWTWDELDRRNKTIAAAANGLDEARCLGIIGECSSEFVDRFIDGMFEV